MDINLCFLNEQGDENSAGGMYTIKLDVLPRIDENLLIDIDNDAFKKLTSKFKVTSIFKVVFVSHGYEDLNDSISTSHTLFVKPIYGLFT